MVKYEIEEIHEDEYIKILKHVGNSKDTDPVIMLIPGNPGLIDYYDTFARYLHDRTGLPVIGLSHTGHLNTNGDSKLKKNWKKCALLQQQIDDKIKYIENHLLKSSDKRLDIILVGHSIGCYILLEMMTIIKKRNLNVNVIKGILIFPTIERMRQSPQGRIVTPVLNYFLQLALLLAFLVSCIPKMILEKIVRMSFKSRKSASKVDPHVINAAYQMVSSYSCMKSLLVMARDEMKLVDRLDFEPIADHRKDVIFYYGLDDHWCPMDYYYDMTKKFETMLPDFNYANTLILDENDLEHAFLIKINQTEILSEKTAEWIKQHI